MWILGVITGVPLFLNFWFWEYTKIWPNGEAVPLVMQVIISVPEITLALFAGIFFGLRGNKWREKNLSLRGYDEVAIMEASTPEAATARYLRSKPLDPERPISRHSDVDKSKLSNRTGTTFPDQVSGMKTWQFVIIVSILLFGIGLFYFKDSRNTGRSGVSTTSYKESFTDCKARCDDAASQIRDVFTQSYNYYRCMEKCRQ
jgi:hypothetical protein